MFITVEEMQTVIYEHVMDDISANDDATVQQCIEAAVSEMKSYLASRYDVAAIFAATGTDRNPLIYEQWRERYDRVIDFLKQVAAGSITPTLPIATDGQGNPVIKSRFGSNPKFQHNY